MPYQPQPAKASTVVKLLLFTSCLLQEGVDKLAYYQGQVQELTKLLNVRLCACVCYHQCQCLQSSPGPAICHYHTSDRVFLNIICSEYIYTMYILLE